MELSTSNYTRTVSSEETIPNEDDVLVALQAKNPRAAQMLLEVFGDRVYGLSLRILGSVEDAQEAVQETFVRIWQKWPSFRGKSKFSSWVYRIAANCAYMRLRKDRHRSKLVSIEQLDQDVSALVDSGSDEQPTGQVSRGAITPDKALENKELMALVDKAVAALPDGNRTAYILKDVEGMPLKDIAAVMDISDAAAKSRIHRARLEVREILKGFLEDLPYDSTQEGSL